MTGMASADSSDETDTLPAWPFHSPSIMPNPSSAPFTDPSESSSATRPPLSTRMRYSTSQIPIIPDLQSPESGSSNQQTHFHTPPRSIFSSAPPTSSVSVNTARASLSPMSSSSSAQPLAALTSASPSPSRKAPTPAFEPILASPAPPTLSNAEKDVDDLTRPVDGPSTERPIMSTPTALSKLFATSETVPPSLSRPPSYAQNASSIPYTRAPSEVASLPSHLYSRGLVSGRHSDITVHAFGTAYALHRIILDRSPFFSSALSGPWAESSAKEMTLHPEELDSNITQTSFELALKRLYGCNMTNEEDKEAACLFATGCWLEMSDLVEASVDSLLRQMHPSKLVSMINLVTSNYYGKPGDRILASAKTMLYREGWEVPYMYWDGIPGEIVREIIGGDAFFVPSEWERWYLTIKLLNRRLKAKAIEAGLMDAHGKFLQEPPTSINFFAVRFDAVYRRASAFGGRHMSKKDEPWLTLYTLPDIEPLLVLIDEGIHYMHLSFEQLQHIRAQVDIFGVPVMPEKVIADALWMQMELRQKVVNAKDSELELGLSQIAGDLMEEEPDVPDIKGKKSSSEETLTDKGKGRVNEVELEDNDTDEMESGSWDGNGKPRKFWIPNTDSTSIMGGTADAFVAAANGTISHTTRHYNRLSATLEPQDVQWASDYSLSNIDRPASSRSRAANEPGPPVTYSHFPPFRFAAEFPSARNLKERKRVYSRTVWYAGSMWNVYIQRVNTSRNSQLGVYLHRAKDKDASDELITGSGAGQGSVDDRIGRLEREMLMRSRERRARRHRVEARPDDEGDTSGSGDLDSTLIPSERNSMTAVASGLNELLRSDGAIKSSQSPNISLNQMDRPLAIAAGEEEEEEDEITKLNNKFRVSTIPRYVDGRPTIKTYFKIYTPSKAGRMLSVYESAPDVFNFSQSWGWKSSTMILDDGILGYDQCSKGKDGRLRFTVVIGNV